MTRKCLIALAVMALSVGSVAHAHEMWAWGVTTTIVYEWAKKECEPIKVYMKVVRWADLYGCHCPVILTQQVQGNGEFWDAGDFVGCKWLKVCNNFVNLRIDAELIATGKVGVKKWYVSLVELPGVFTTREDKTFPDTHPDPKWNLVRDGLWGVLPGDKGQVGDNGAKTTLLVPGVHLTGALGWLSLCARAVNIDPQSAQFFPNNPLKNIVHAATIHLTFYPNDPPGLGDFLQGAIGSDGGPFPTDDLNDPDVTWGWNQEDGLTVTKTGSGGGVAP
jgi:hypothetical protein